MAGDHSHEGTHFLSSFPVIFFGSLAIAGIIAFILHNRLKGLPKIGQKYYDPIVLILGMWCLVGLLIDAFAHIAGEVDDTFFTPWHAIWYSGSAAYGAYIFYAILPEGGFQQLIKSPFSVLKGIENHHKPGVYGIIVFAISGFGDMIWHELLGVEENTDILLSPTHIGLFTGLIMSVTAPVWSAWADAKSGKDGLKSQLLLVFGVGAAWTVCLLMFKYANLWLAPLQSYCYSATLDYCWYSDYNEALQIGLRSMYIQAALTTAVLAVFLQRWSPERGSMFVLFSFNALGVWVYSTFDYSLLWMGLILAVIAEIFVFIHRMKGPKWYIPFMVAMQIIVLIGFMLISTADISDTRYWIEGVNLHVIPFGWSIHSTVGSIVVSATIAWVGSIIAFPSKMPKELPVK
ncbi:MAG: hypothetical protein CMB73_03940 [Euryarchaeota archaeon]|nr:hypothetical protein [Euryarchaeota archaeon]|tara:strand:- start:232 stop:1440 length:1209 start_codon:yes stop_codon:yes gene_type:complete